MLRARLFEVDMNLHRLLRYPLSLLKTVAVLFAAKPELLLVQNPSLVLALFSVCYGRMFRIPVIVDAHNAGLFPLEGGSPWLDRIATQILRMATTTIVSNAQLAEHVSHNGGIPFVIPDPIPELEPPRESARLRGKFSVLFVCSWAADEPYLEVAKAAEALGSRICIYMTGERRKAERCLGGKHASNVILTDYLSESDYVTMLYSCDVIVVLTNREHCLMCGAYEAVAAEKPLVLSDTSALREFFSRGVVYTDNTTQDIARKIRVAIERKDELEREIRALKQDLRERSFSTISAFEDHLRKRAFVT